MNRCLHCDLIIEDAKRKKFCSNWCAADYKQPEENKSWKTEPTPTENGVYIEKGDK